MRLIPIALVVLFMGQSLGRTLYVNRYEFWPAAAEWHDAHDRGDMEGMMAAMRKERVAHCRTFDPLWFYQPWANDCSP